MRMLPVPILAKEGFLEIPRTGGTLSSLSPELLLGKNSTAQTNFLRGRESSVSGQPKSVTTSRTWLLSAWNVAGMTEKLSFSLYST